MSATDQAIEAYNSASRKVAALYRERGDLSASVIETRVSAYQTCVIDGGTVSDARHASDLASITFSQEVAKLGGEIDGALVELRYLDQLLAHLRGRNA